MIVEFKYDKSVEGAIEQIKKKQYADYWKDYSGEILLVGINYNKVSMIVGLIKFIDKIF